jgi:hypothetical protein
MSQPIATYSFLPWLRSGLANQITSADLDNTVKLRAEVQVALEVSGTGLDAGTVAQTVTRDVALFGPGDIVGIEERARIRVEPRHWITNFEPNYFPFVEFYDEDFPWRYTPAAPDLARGRLRPWIALVVLAEGEFEEGKGGGNAPLPHVEVADLGLFPPAEQLWAWTHVHVNRSLAGSSGEFVSTDMGAVIPRLQAVLDENPDLAYARLLCPRKLAPSTAYHAFLVPTFESGRLAGLGLDPGGSPYATFSAWDPAYPTGTRSAPNSFPYYHRWQFRTATTGDFESLVRLLKPQPVDKRVGTRALDVQVPGSNVRGLDDPSLHGFLQLGGALRVPRADFTPDELAEIDRYEHWDTPYPRPIQEDLTHLVNLADDYAQGPAADANAATGMDGVGDDPDPLVTPPLYGTWHALTKRLLADRAGAPLPDQQNWVHQLNLDPRHRVAAGFGTRVVQRGQEQYMDAAWEQVGQVLEANRRIRLGQLARQVSRVWFDAHLTPAHASSPERALTLMAPLSRRVMASPNTVHHVLSGSRVQPALMSGAMRRVVRPRGRLVRTLPFTAAQPASALLTRVNAGEVSPAPPKVAPPGTGNLDQVAGEAAPSGVPEWLLDLLRRFPWLRHTLLVIAVILVLLLILLGAGAFGLVLAIALVVAGAFAARALGRWAQQAAVAAALGEAGQTPASVDALPGSTDFNVTEPSAGFTPTLGGADGPEAMRFKEALRGGYALLQRSSEAGAPPVRTAIDLPGISQTMLARIDPQLTIPRRVMASIFLPPRIRAELGEAFVEAMAYPVIDAPMYKPLIELSAELFLPNLNFIAPNSITLLETNQAFIEAYMVGLNHEFARELLWREYPTDRRGSSFRQFWDVSVFFDPSNADDEALKERLRDIPPLHLWAQTSKLGDHDARERPGDSGGEVVLVMRGELLKRYPTAVIYAHRAVWQLKPDGSIDPTRERLLVELTDAEEQNPPRTKVRTPLYEAKVDPDIYFFGFDLTVDAARGGTGEHPTDDPGWFFVIKERPGDPRFRLDVNAAPRLEVWNDLSWEDVLPGPPGGFVQITDATAPLAVAMPTGPEAAEKIVQYGDDRNITWSKDMSSADLAYILFKAPVLVAVHASEMLAPR